MTALIATLPGKAAARTGAVPQTGALHASRGLPQDIDAVIGLLAGSGITRLRAAASRLQPLTAADLVALESAADLHLAELIGSLRLQYAAQSDRASADRAIRAAIDLPQALRADVHKTRGKAPQEGAA